MFLSFYGLEFNPFDKDINSKHAYLTNDLKIMNNRLEFLKEHPSIALFTGNAGMGKTFAIRSFIDSLNPNLFKCIYISMSSTTVMDFYRQLCFGLGLIPTHRKSDMFKQIQECIINLVKNKKIKVIICLDEAQYLKTDILNDLKMLMNFEMDSKNYFTLILSGQPILNDLLNRNVQIVMSMRLFVRELLSVIISLVLPKKNLLIILLQGLSLLMVILKYSHPLPLKLFIIVLMVQ